MKQKRILFFGDSNTYGYDPADYRDFRYPEPVRWITQVKKALGESWRVYEDGMNGRCIPSPSELGFLKRSLEKMREDPDSIQSPDAGEIPKTASGPSQAEDYLVVMLGTNDLLNSPWRQERVQEKMESFLSCLVGIMDPDRILLIAPPPCQIQEGSLPQAFARMNQGFESLSRRFGVHFQDSAAWDISLCSDFVHFSEEGHHRFAKCLVPLLRQLWESASFRIRPSSLLDLPRLLEIYALARQFMAEHGNPNQWGPNQWPPKTLLEQDIQEGHSFVCLCQDRIVGTFFFEEGVDIEPTYQVIEAGQWLCEDAYYGVVHRIATDGTTRGVGSFCLSWAYKRVPHLRIDTHPDNRVMQGMLEKNGFQKCGVTHVPQDKDERWAYEKV